MRIVGFPNVRNFRIYHVALDVGVADSDFTDSVLQKRFDNGRAIRIDLDFVFLGGYRALQGTTVRQFL